MLERRLKYPVIGQICFMTFPLASSRAIYLGCKKCALLSPRRTNPGCILSSTLLKKKLSQGANMN